MRHMDFWETGQHVTLLADNMAERRSWLARAAHVSDEIEVRAFNLKVPKFNLQEAVIDIYV